MKCLENVSKGDPSRRVRYDGTVMREVCLRSGFGPGAGVKIPAIYNILSLRLYELNRTLYGEHLRDLRTQPGV